MAERCDSCGAELFTGQQFCRACGAPTRQFSGEELPTQILPHQQQQQPQRQPSDPTPPPPFSTSPLPSRDTSDPVYKAAAGYPNYQPPAAPGQRYTSPVGAPPPESIAPPLRRRSRAWVYAVLGLLLFFAGASVVAGLFFLNRPRPQQARGVKVTRPQVVTPPMPPMPAIPSLEADEDLRPEEGAEVSGEQTVITKTYPLAKDGSFSLRNFSGDIAIEGWDEQQAEVKIIKRGGSAAQGEALAVAQEQTPTRLVFNTTPEKLGGVREVRYVVKLPRNLRELEIVSINSNVDLTNISTASISVNVQRGNIEMEDVSGTVNSRTTKGNTTIVLSEAATAAGGPQVFNGIHGNIELELAPGTNAELKAETVDGDIKIDEDLGVRVEKRMVGQQAVGRLGKGGPPIVVKVVSGNIKIGN